MSKLDPETADGLKNSISPLRLRSFASVLDFFGGDFEIRQGKALVPAAQNRLAPGQTSPESLRIRVPSSSRS